MSLQLCVLNYLMVKLLTRPSASAFYHYRSTLVMMGMLQSLRVKTRHYHSCSGSIMVKSDIFENIQNYVLSMKTLSTFQSLDILRYTQVQSLQLLL